MYSDDESVLSLLPLSIWPQVKNVSRKSILNEWKKIWERISSDHVSDIYVFRSYLCCRIHFPSAQCSASPFIWVPFIFHCWFRLRQSAPIMYILILIWSLSCCHFLLSWVPETEINKLMISPFDFVCPLGGNRHTAGSHRLLGAFPGGCRWTAKLHRGAVLHGEDKRSDGVREAFVGGTSKWKNFFRDCFFPTTSRMVINNVGLNIMNKNYRLENWNFVFTTFKYANKHKSRKVICVVRTFTLKVVNLSN